MPSFGLIVEGQTDAEVFSRLTPRVDTPGSRVYVLECRGVGPLMATFPTLLRRFEYVHNGQPVDKALVIRDCDRKPIDEVRQRMLEKLGNHRFSFPVELCVVRRCTETWLMADENAIGEVALQRGGRRIPRVNEALEEIVDAKLRFVRCLSDGKLTYGPRVLSEIAERINIQSLRDRLPSFAPFERQVNR